MKKFASSALVIVAVIVLSSFAVTRTNTWICGQYPLARAFRSTGNQSTVVQVPATGGFIITQVRVRSQGGTVTITVNGTAETFNALLPSNFAEGFIHDLNPPIIVRPNDVFGVSTNTTYVIGGYTTLPGET